ncbi:hypothetical protein FB45DRAFT_425065 [Roridomyces roridus]|uniref:F-box domain-containing protein n=1 Tax=Roridomyces roridus TaxID=1738132 RepID=A0AAD7FV47_9AGAR|nr:hypothetical protein FB45DRAFT_425065 [Roridomyces roridus]
MHPPNAALRTQVAQVLVDISNLETRLKEKHAELGRLQHQLDAVIYPVLSLPPEIVSEIFVLCLPTERMSMDMDALNWNEAPLLLSHICGQWRHIALAMPALWRELDIELLCPSRRAHDLEMIETWLERARKHPLSLRIKAPTSEFVDTPFTQTFFGHASTIQSLDLDLMDNDLEMVTRRVEFPILRKLYLRASDEYGRDGFSDDAIEMFDEVPRLSEVLLYYIPAHLVVLPWQQLQKFTGDFYNVSQCLQALELMPNITECAFSIEVEEGESDFNVVSHPEMRCFTLFYSECVGMGGAAYNAKILKFLTFPKLESLELLDVEAYNEGDLHAFFDRGSPPLQRLLIRPHANEGFGNLTMGMKPLLESHLTYLEVWYPTPLLITRFFRRFGDEQTFTPGLQELAFTCRNRAHEASRNVVLDRAGGALTMRTSLAGVAQLRVFRVDAVGKAFSGYRDEELLPFRKLKEHGMEVYITHRGGPNLI